MFGYRLHVTKTAPRQGCEGPPEAWQMFDEAFQTGLCDERNSDVSLLLAWLHEADRIHCRYIHAAMPTRR